MVTFASTSFQQEGLDGKNARQIDAMGSSLYRDLKYEPQLNMTGQLRPYPFNGQLIPDVIQSLAIE